MAECGDTRGGQRGHQLIWLTKHATMRRAQRAISSSAVAIAIQAGLQRQLDGCVVFFLGRRQLEGLKLEPQELERLEGVTVILSREGRVITTYKNRNGLDCTLRRRGHCRRRRR
jgi:hypothetical protein